jgi:hypothetical protein
MVTVQEIYSKLGLERPDRFIQQSLKAFEEKIYPQLQESKRGWEIRRTGQTTLMLAQALERASLGLDVVVLTVSIVHAHQLCETLGNMLEILNLKFRISSFDYIRLGSEKEKGGSIRFARVERDTFVDLCVNYSR